MWGRVGKRHETPLCGALSPDPQTLNPGAWVPPWGLTCDGAQSVPWSGLVHWSLGPLGSDPISQAPDSEPWALGHLGADL